MATIPSLDEAEDTFTSTRIREVLKPTNARPPATWEPQFEVETFRRKIVNRETGRVRLFSAEQMYENAKAWCGDLYDDFKASNLNLLCLDDAYAKLLFCNFQGVQHVDQIVSGVSKLLRRLPVVSMELHNPKIDPLYSDMAPECFITNNEPGWVSLRFARFISRNVLCMAVEMQLLRSNLRDSDYEALIDVTSEVLRAAMELSTAKPSLEWFLIKAFLWSSWQRMTTLYHNRQLQIQLRGFDARLHLNTALKGAEIYNTVLKSQLDSEETCAPAYMCKWALRVLREDKAIVGRDFRRFFQIFSQTFAGRIPRCTHINGAAAKSCDGRKPRSCLRFFGLKIENQSAHSLSCSGTCKRLYWDEDSWKAVGGGAAVALDLGPGSRIRYIHSSERTLAISHVWSHGQGGRPENDPDNEGTGFNSCLHHRYSKIARLYGCDSYWMDTPCIPTDHALRKDAIRNINRIFTESKMTLICDKDLMSIDVQNLNISVEESILTTILVCDWNVRAWTTLEAFRGRKSLYILCKDDHVVSLHNVAQNVCESGAMELSGLFLSAQHLIPFDPDNRPIEQRQRLTKDDTDSRFADMYRAADILSCRHASREGDEIVIWTLLYNDIPFDNMVDIWRNREYVRTGWLVSDLPRINQEGLSWAPSHPNFHHSDKDYDQQRIPYDGLYSRLGEVLDVGLLAEWSAYGIFSGNLKRNRWKILKQKMFKGYKTDLELNLPGESLWSQITSAGLAGNSRESFMALLKPLPVSSYEPIKHPRWPSKQILVVVASDGGIANVPRNQKKKMPLRSGDFAISSNNYVFRKWRWKGILELDQSTTPIGFKDLWILIS
ncbi:uncharacterized protein PV09_06549 [Verruconis gallopava]|uniref:Heterokaryon incompatibility domain-containing protein n=1 Tax=Verruconis gallopava TaxID=253628 RepID=A0A0D1YMT3_9PEZI|nr:uncharacterized protein PV09_06549 [Verruconis gallopava]KIW02047.1 hypothetical protein PV09_06549 [Verruconis gallopava]